MIIKKSQNATQHFFMILCIMVIVEGMARFSPALIYRRFIFETRSVGGVLALTAYNAYFRCSHEIALPLIQPLN